MINKILNYLTPTKKLSTKSIKNFVSIISDPNTINVSEELQIVREAKDVIENFARKNNIKVDMFFKEANASNVHKQMVKVQVSDFADATNTFAEHTVVYRENNEPTKFIAKKPNIRYVKHENKVNVQRIKSDPMEVTVFDTVVNKISKQKVELPDIIIHIKEYNNYEVPQKVGEGVYQDSFLRHIYRVIEKLNEQLKKTH